jgi:membrane fusion protein, heavy metal efflux system
MNRSCLWILLAVAGSVSCRQNSPPRPKANAGEPRKQTITHWTDRTELFLEYPALVAGARSRFAVHFTRLDTFKPQKDGQAEVVLECGGATQTFRSPAPSRPGIFGVDVQPAHPGTCRMSVSLSAPGLSDRHGLGEVAIRASAQTVAALEETPIEQTMPFLKEQQWALDFSTELVRERPAREVLRVPAEISPRSGGEAAVAAPFSGRLVSSGLPPMGAPVEKGQVLVTIVPPAANPSELPALELASAEAEAALELARKERLRAERLLSAGAGPARRVDEARYAERSAEARVTAAGTRLRQYQAAREAAEQQTAGPFLLRAPIRGLIAESHAVSGSNVEAGAELFRIVDPDLVYVSAIVPESELPRIAQFREAELEMPAPAPVRKLNRLVSVMRFVDPDTRTFRVIYETSNRDRLLAINQTAFARLLGPAGTLMAAVPVSSVIDDGGMPVVFVQLEGEAFARRPVKLGVVEGEYVQALEGVRAGERVVSRGAYLIRLSALSSQIPAHGHVH